MENNTITRKTKAFFMSPSHPDAAVEISEQLYEFPLHDISFRSLLERTIEEKPIDGIYKESSIAVLNEKLWFEPEKLPYTDYRKEMKFEKVPHFEVCQVQPDELWIYYTKGNIAFSVKENQDCVIISTYLNKKLLSQTICFEYFILDIISYKMKDGKQYQARIGKTSDPMTLDIFVKELDPETKQEVKYGYKAVYGEEDINTEAFLF